MHLVLPIKLIKKEKFLDLVDGENKSIISSSGYINNQLLEDYYYYFKNFKKIEDMDLLIKSITIAIVAHYKQLDKGNNPYILHPFRVMETVYNISDLNFAIVGILHDTIEDTFVSEKLLLEMNFPNDIIEAINIISRKENESYMDFIKRCSENPITVQVKLADLKDNSNLRRLKEVTEKDEKRLQKYEKAIRYLNQKENYKCLK